MKAQEFVVYGRIQAKQRPRFNSITGRVYTPPKTTNYEELVRQCYSDYSKHYKFTLITGAIRAEIIAFMPIAKSRTKKEKELMRNAELRPTLVPDTDNIAKSILDALNKVAYEDDKQIVELEVKKYYADEPRVIVKLIALEG